MRYLTVRVCTRRVMADFLNLPDLIYRNDPAWIPPLSSEVRRTLDPRRNPYFDGVSLEMFVCYGDGKPAARVAVVINPNHQKKFRTRSAFFGFFESINDERAAHSLFREAGVHCRNRGVEVLEGPFNPNHYSELGLQLDQFGKPPTFFQTHNPPYYAALLSAVGFRQSKLIFTAKNAHVSEYIRQTYGLIEPAPQEGEYTLRHVRSDTLSDDLESIRSVFNDAFSDNWHFLPATREEYRFSTKFLRYVTEPKLIALVEHRGQPAGVLMCVLDVNPLLRANRGRMTPFGYLRFMRGRKRIRRLVVFAVGIRRAYQRTRVYKLLLDEMCRMAAGYDALETTWISGDNTLAVRAASRMGMSPDKHFAIYEKSVRP